MTARVQIHFEFFPEAWAPGVSEKFYALLVGQDRLFPARRMGNEGKQVLPDEDDEIRAMLVERYEWDSRGNLLQLFVDKGKTDFWFDLARVEWGEGAGFGSTLFWPKSLTIIVPYDHWQAADWLGAIAEVARITEAPLVSLDYTPDERGTSSFYECRNHMKRVLQATVHGTAMMGSWRGLGRIKWARLFGPHITAMLGADRLAALPDGTAKDHGGGYWLVSTTEDPAASGNPEGLAIERAITEALGPEHFFDPETPALATVVPDFPARLIPDDAVLFERYGPRLKPL